MPVSDPTDTDALEQALLATYDTNRGRPADEIVAQYDHALEIKADRPDATGAIISEAVGRPSSTVRAWLRGENVPDAARGRDRAREEGWLDLAWRGTTLQTLTVLAVWAQIRGTISPRTYAPAWIPREGTEPELHDACWDLDVPIKLQRHDDGRPMEARPTGDSGGAVLGRVLHVLGASVGARGEDDPPLPPWLDVAPYPVRVDALRVVLRQQGTLTGDDAEPVVVTPERSGSPHGPFRADFLDAVADLASGVTDGVTREEGVVRFDERAASLLTPSPARGKWLP